MLRSCFFLADLDQGLAGGGGVAPALVPDRLGEAVQGEDLGEGVSCLADHPDDLFVRVTLLFEQAIESLGLFDGGEVLAEEVLHKGDLGVVSLNEEGGDGGQACLFRRWWLWLAWGTSVLKAPFDNGEKGD